MTARQMRAALKKLKLSQSEAARRLGIKHPTIWRYLNGKLKIPGPVAAAIECWARMEGNPT